MKQIKIGLLALTVLAAMSGCSGVSPGGDEEAVLIEKPWIFGHGGVDQSPVSSGNEWVALSTDNVKFKITPVRYTEEFENLMTSDNNPVTFGVYFTFQVQRGNTPRLFKGWGEKWYENTLQQYLRTMVIDKASPYHMFDLTTKREISSTIERDLNTSITTLLKNIKDKDGKEIPITLVSVSVGAITPPKEVIDETSKTAAQAQAKLTQDARLGVETSRKLADIKKGDADLAYMQTMGFTADQYLRLRALEIEKEKIELVKDNKNATVILGDGTSVQPMVPIK